MYEFGIVEESFWIFTLRTLAPDRMILDEWLTSIQIFEMRSVMHSVKVSQHYVSSRVPLGQLGYKIVSRWKGVRNIGSEHSFKGYVVVFSSCDAIFLLSQLLAILGEQFIVGNEICGAVISVRPTEDIISLWNRTANDNAITGRIR